jgi:aldehyde dehydrogenase (NAD+)
MTSTELSFKLFIDGRWDDGDGSDVIDVVNPATEERIGVVPQANAKDVRRAIEAARRAFDDGPWPKMSVTQRSAALIRMVEVLERRAPELIDLSIREGGSVRWFAESIMVNVPIAHFRDMAERVMLGFEYEKPLVPYVGADHGFGFGVGQGVNLREPYGVAGLISAYNAATFLNLFKIAPALAAGCTTVLKPAPTVPLQALLLGEIAEEAGLPRGVLNIVTGDVEAAQELTINPAVDMISFTGSDAVGRLVYRQASATMKKVVLELGGKSANIVCDDADLSKVALDVVGGMTVHAGQGCSLLTRTLVHESRHDELVSMVKAILSQMKVGDPADEDTAIGPLISAAQREKVERLIKVGQDEGANIVYGGGRPTHLKKGFFVEPTLFVDVDNSMTVAQKEFFGPVGVVIPFKDDAEAVRLANDSDFGLGGGVWAKDPSRAYAIAKQVRTGTINVNGGGGSVSPYVAFGGYKQSGLGREFGGHGLDEFLQTKSVAWSVASG